MIVLTLDSVLALNISAAISTCYKKSDTPKMPNIFVQSSVKTGLYCECVVGF